MGSKLFKEYGMSLAKYSSSVSMNILLSFPCPARITCAMDLSS